MLEAWLRLLLRTQGGAPMKVWGYGALDPEHTGTPIRSRYSKTGITGWLPLTTSDVSTAVRTFDSLQRTPSHPVGTPLIISEGSLDATVTGARFKKTRLGFAAATVLASQGSDRRPRVNKPSTTAGALPSAVPMMSGGVVLSRRCAVMISARELRALLGSVDLRKQSPDHHSAGFGTVCPRLRTPRAAVAGSVARLRNPCVIMCLIGRIMQLRLKRKSTM